MLGSTVWDMSHSGTGEAGNDCADRWSVYGECKDSKGYACCLSVEPLHVEHGMPETTQQSPGSDSSRRPVQLIIASRSLTYVPTERKGMKHHGAHPSGWVAQTTGQTTAVKLPAELLSISLRQIAPHFLYLICNPPAHHALAAAARDRLKERRASAPTRFLR